METKDINKNNWVSGILKGMKSHLRPMIVATLLGVTTLGFAGGQGEAERVMPVSPAPAGAELSPPRQIERPAFYNELEAAWQKVRPHITDDVYEHKGSYLFRDNERNAAELQGELEIKGSVREHLYPFLSQYMEIDRAEFNEKLDKVSIYFSQWADEPGKVPGERGVYGVEDDGRVLIRLLNNEYSDEVVTTIHEFMHWVGFNESQAEFLAELLSGEHKARYHHIEGMENYDATYEWALYNKVGKEAYMSALFGGKYEELWNSKFGEVLPKQKLNFMRDQINAYTRIRPWDNTESDLKEFCDENYNPRLLKTRDGNVSADFNNLSELIQAYSRSETSAEKAQIKKAVVEILRAAYAYLSSDRERSKKDMMYEDERDSMYLRFGSLIKLSPGYNKTPFNCRVELAECEHTLRPFAVPGMGIQDEMSR